MKKIVSVVILTILAFSQLFAQKSMGQNPEMYEKIKSEKISFFTSKLDLKPAEAQAFWPIYNEFEKKRFEIHGQVHNFERMPEDAFLKLSDAEIDKITNEFIASFEKEALLFKEYNKEFLKVLPKKKVLMMYRAENEFRSYLIKEYRKEQKKE